MKTPSCSTIAVIGFLAVQRVESSLTPKQVCSLRNTPVSELEYDPDSDTFFVHDRRTLRAQQSQRMAASSLSAPPKELITGHDSRSLHDSETASATFSVHYCDCFEDHEPIFCPAQSPYCGVVDKELKCFTSPPHREIASNAFYVAMAWMSFLFFWLICSVPGNHLRHYVLGWVVPSWDDYLLSKLQRETPERALYMMRHHLRITHRSTREDPEWVYDANAVRRLMMELEHPQGINDDKADEGRRPVALRLSTCPYQGTAAAQDPQDDSTHNDSSRHLQVEDDCAICYQELQVGDRIGALVCHHTFHVDCLKEWCVRRNACPLCNHVDIAAPQFDNDVERVAADMRRNLRL